MRMLTTVVAIALAGAMATLDADQTTNAGVRLATFESRALRGAPSLLAWSPDGRLLYLQAADRDHYGRVKSMTHWVVTVADRSAKQVEQEPDWAEPYWQWKSGRRSPASPTAMIDIETGRKGFHSTNIPTGGDLGRGGGDTGQTAEDAWSAAYQTQNATVFTLRWKGQTIGEWMNEPMIAGSNYSWAPPPRVALAAAPRDGGPLFVVNDRGDKTTLPDTRAATLPAWSPDGHAIAWLERSSRKQFVLVLADAPTP